MPHWKPEPRLLTDLDSAIPGILETQKPNGEFGTEPWISTDQNVMLALAAAWSLEGGLHHHSNELLSSIVLAGDALINEMDDAGMWTFRKKDHSTWGQIYQPWIYSRWIRAYQLTRDAFDEADRERWDKALIHGFTGIAETCFERLHNIPMHHAMGLYTAGLVFDRDDWREQAGDFSVRIADHQSEYGWWPEHDAPVIMYNLVYVESLGIYYTMSKDERVLPALARAASYHANFVYPDGSLVETVDSRNHYRRGIRPGNPGFSHTPEGRGFLMHQHSKLTAAGESFGADYAANMLLHAGEGEAAIPAAASDTYDGSMGDLAAVRRRSPWFICCNAFRQEPHDIRWGQDFQNFVSVFHDKTGLIMGGGNTKMQPLWSNFTVGDRALLHHEQGDEVTVFTVEGLRHVPDKAQLKPDGLTLQYGDIVAHLTTEIVSDSEARIVASVDALPSSEPVEGHLTFIPDVDQDVLIDGESVTLGEDPVVKALVAGSTIAHNGWQLKIEADARIEWPALPHNPYAKGGNSPIQDGRIVLAFPMTESAGRFEAVLSIL